MISRKAALACALLLLLPAVVVWDLNGDSFDLRDRQLVLVVTDSMDGDNHEYDIGSFPANTLVMVEHLPLNEVRYLHKGDVISFRDGELLVHHRITVINQDSFYVNGDNGHATTKVMFEDVNGKVVGTNVWLGHTVAWISHNFMVFLGMMFVVCSALVVLAFRPPKSELEVES